MQVAQTILQQLGGNKFLAMTGSKNLASGSNYLRMNLVTNKTKAKYLYIYLEANDTYRMEFVSVNRNLDRVVKKEYTDVYFDQLQELFTEATGLYTSL